MPGRAARPLTPVLLLTLSAACIRSTLDVPPASDGAAINGSLVERDRASGELVPLEGARVEMLAEPYAVRSNPVGLFAFERLPLGRHVLQVRRAPSASSSPTVVKVLGNVALDADGQSMNLGTIEVGGPGTLVGRVSLADATDTSAAEGTQVAVARTSFAAIVGRDGEWKIGGLPEGDFELVAYRAGYTPARLRRVSVTSGEEHRVLPLVLARGPQVGSARVTGQVSLQGASDASGVAVELYDESRTSSVTGMAVSAASGTYTLELTIGVHRARFSKAGYRTVWLRGVAVLPEGVLGLLPVTLGAVVAGDLDGDGVGDAADDDRDGDGCANASDAFPDDELGCLDTDGDGVPDELDADDDGDVLADVEETSEGRDGWETDARSADTDGDGVRDNVDVCPTVADASQVDADRDGIGDACEASAASPGSTAGSTPGSSPGSTPGSTPGSMPGSTPGGSTTATVALAVSGFSPAAGGPGTRVIVRGQGFRTDRADLNVVSFGRGVAVASQATAGDIMVEVPPNADSGPLRVFNGRSAVTSSAAFTVYPAPAIESFSPTRATIGAKVIVYGAGFEVPGLRVRVGAAVARAVVLAAANGLERVEVTVPDAPSAPIRLETDGGSTATARALEILGPPSVTRITPNPAPPGAQLSIGGIGFTAAAPEEITVEFAGGAMATATRVTGDSYISVEVPANAATGPIRLRHAQWTAASSDPLTIDPELPAIRRVFPLVPMPGEDVRIDGTNFHAPPRRTLVSVTFGGVPTTTITLGDTVLFARVPANANPGPLVITTRLADSRQPTTQSAPLWLMRRTNGPQLRDPRGMGFNGPGDRLYAVDATTWHTYRTTTLTQEAQGAITLPNFDPSRGSTIEAFQVSPNGDLAILTINGIYGLATWILDLPGFTPRFNCGNDGVVSRLHSNRFRFDWTSENAFGTTPQSAQRRGVETIWHIDMNRRRCATLAETPVEAGRNSAVLPMDQPRQILVADSRRGFALMDVETTSPTYGMFISPFIGPPTEQTQLFWDPSNSGVWAFDGSVHTRRHGPIGANPTTILVDSTAGSDVSQSSDRRWFFFVGMENAVTPRAFLVDTDTQAIVRRGEFDLQNSGTAAHPSDTLFIMSANDRITKFALVGP